MAEEPKSIQEELSLPILLFDQLIKLAQEAESSKADCVELANQADRLSHKLRSAVCSSPLYLTRSTCAIHSPRSSHEASTVRPTACTSSQLLTSASEGSFMAAATSACSASNPPAVCKSTKSGKYCFLKEHKMLKIDRSTRCSVFKFCFSSQLLKKQEWLKKHKMFISSSTVSRFHK